MTSEEVHYLRQQLIEVQGQLASAEDRADSMCQDNARLESELLEKTRQNEELQQNTYSLGLKLASTESTLQSCSAELEALQAEHDSNEERLRKQHTVNVERVRMKVCELEQRCEVADAEQSTLQSQLMKALQRVEEATADAAQEGTERAGFLGQDNAEEIRRQLECVTREKQELTQRVLRVTAERDSAEQRVLSAERTLLALSTQLEDKEGQLSISVNEVQRLKEEQQELQQELEMCRLNEKDPKGKGNSIFAEVEDNRLFLEQQLVKVQTNYTTVVKQYKAKAQQVSRLKLQVASLLSLAGSGGDGEYVSHLNESLLLAGSQVTALRQQVEEQCVSIREQRERPLVLQCRPDSCMARSAFVRRTFEANEKDLSTLKDALKDARFQGVLLSDQLLQLQRRLHASECSCAQLRTQCMKLTVQLHEIRDAKGIFADAEAQAPPETRLEILPECVDTVASAREQRVKTSPESEGRTTAAALPSTAAGNAAPGAASAIALSVNANIPLNKESEPNVVAETLEWDKPNILQSHQLINKDPVGTQEIERCEEEGASMRPVDSILPREEQSLLQRRCQRDSVALQDDVFEANKENTSVTLTTAAAVADPPAKKAKKTVTLQDAVAVQDGDGELHVTTLKPHDGDLSRPRKTLRRLVPPTPSAAAPDVSQCNQQ